MKVFYLVQAHYRPECFGALIDALSGPRSRVVAHIDAKIDDAPFRNQAGSSNVTFVPNGQRVRVNWAGWSQVEATLAMARLAMEEAEPNDYLILMSGDTYPLGDQDSIYEFLNSAGKPQYINGVSMPAPHKPIERIARFHVEYDRRDGRRHAIARSVNRLQIRKPYRRALGGRVPFGGTQWWGLTGSAVAWILETVETDGRLVRLAQGSLIPDEFLFQTLVLNSEFGQDVRPSLMFTDWSRPGPKPAHIDADHVRLLAEANLQPASDSAGQRLFARKVMDSFTQAQIRQHLWPIAHRLGRDSWNQWAN